MITRLNNNDYDLYSEYVPNLDTATTDTLSVSEAAKFGQIMFLHNIKPLLPRWGQTDRCREDLVEKLDNLLQTDSPKLLTDDAVCFRSGLLAFTISIIASLSCALKYENTIVDQLFVLLFMGVVGGFALLACIAVVTIPWYNIRWGKRAYKRIKNLVYGTQPGSIDELEYALIWYEGRLYHKSKQLISQHEKLSNSLNSEITKCAAILQDLPEEAVISRKLILEAKQRREELAKSLPQLRKDIDTSLRKLRDAVASTRSGMIKINRVQSILEIQNNTEVLEEQASLLKLEVSKLELAVQEMAAMHTSISNEFNYRTAAEEELAILAG